MGKPSHAWVAGLVLAAWALAVAAAEEGGLGAGLVNPGYEEKPAWFKASFLDLRDDVEEATANGRRVLLYFYQDGCPYCAKLLRENFTNRTIVARTRAHFDVIAINIWGDREVTDTAGNALSEKEFAFAHRVMYTPTLLFLDESGEAVLRLNGYYPPHQFATALDYVAERQERELPFREFYARRDPAPPSGTLHGGPGFLDPATDLRPAARGGRPLVVFFEQRACAPCDELHDDLLARPEIANALARLDRVVIDVGAAAPVMTPGGAQLAAGDWARRLELNYIPALVFFDGAGREVFRAEAFLRGFHLHAAIDYVSTGAYLGEPEFQRFVQARADALRARGIEVDLMR